MRLHGNPRGRRSACRRRNFARGGEFPPNQSVTLEAKNLNPDTPYLILAAALNGDKYSPVEQLAMTTLADQVDDSYTDLDLIVAFYMGDTNGVANWIVKFETPVNDRNEWYEVYYGLWTEEIPDLNNLILPTGTFTVNTDWSAGTFEPEYTFQRHYPSETATAFTGGTIEITAEGSNYTILGDLTDDRQNEYHYRYVGAVNTDDQSPHHLPLITEDVNTRFVPAANGTYLGDYYKTGTSLISLTFIGDFPIMYVDFLAPGAPYSADVLQPGTYTVRSDHGEYSLAPGYEFNEGGWRYIPQGTYCQVISETDTYGFATGGTITVEKMQDGRYSIVFDLTTNNDKSITATFTGTINVKDGTEAPVISELDEDRVLDLTPITRGRMEFCGNWYNNGMNEWRILLRNETIDGIDGMIFDFNMPTTGFVPEGMPTGTYELSSVAQENTMIPGFINTYLAGTWYIWDNRFNQYGKKAPIKTGSLTLGKEGDTWTVEFEMWDDARPAHKISGQWSGPMDIIKIRD